MSAEPGPESFQLEIGKATPTSVAGIRLCMGAEVGQRITDWAKESGVEPLTPGSRCAAVVEGAQSEVYDITALGAAGLAKWQWHPRTEEG